MKTSLRVELAERGYDIVIGEKLIEKAGLLLAPLLRRPKVIIITDEMLQSFIYKTLKPHLIRAI